VIGVYVTAL